MRILLLISAFMLYGISFAQSTLPSHWNVTRPRYSTDPRLNNFQNGTGPYFQYPALYSREHFKNYFDWGRSTDQNYPKFLFHKKWPNEGFLEEEKDHPFIEAGGNNTISFDDRLFFMDSTNPEINL